MTSRKMAQLNDEDMVWSRAAKDKDIENLDLDVLGSTVDGQSIVLGTQGELMYVIYFAQSVHGLIEALIYQSGGSA